MYGILNLNEFKDKDNLDEFKLLLNMFLNSNKEKTTNSDEENGGAAITFIPVLC